MTVMLLQRSATPQSTSEKTATKECNPQLPLLFLLDEHQEHHRFTATNLIDGTIGAAVVTTSNIATNVTTTSPTKKTSQHNVIGHAVNHANSHGSSHNHNHNHNNNDIFKECARRGSNRAYLVTGVTSAPTSASSQRRLDGVSRGVAMRYYRLWIYACNVVLLGSAVGFTAAVSRTILFSSDPRRQVIPGIPRAFDPTALYAYLALAGQLGLVQLLGCIAARRLSARLLNAYWLLLLALLFGDAVIGVAWVFRFERMRAEMKPMLRLRLQMDYGKEPRFSENWDRLQKEFTCCGVTGPRDFGSRWPQTCCAPSLNASDPCQQPYTRGCEESLTRWLRKTADLLFVLGFCVIAFAKLCFLGILRYEIREMIQKIRLLREPPPPATPFAQPTVAQIMSDPTNNGGIVRRTTLPNAMKPSGNLLLQSDDCGTGRHPLLSNNLQDTGADSDTNSHCALILEETTPTSTNHNCANREKSNGNNNYEMREFNRRLLLSNGGSPGAGITAGGGGLGQNRRT